jgi:hypothetical protein
MSGVSAKAAKALILALPGIEESTSHGVPGFKLRGVFFARLRDDDTVLALRLPIPDRELLMEAAPEIYFVTDHYRGYPSVLVRLAAIGRSELQALLEQAWRAKATKAAVKAFDAAKVKG